jgi:hypothetical protein
MKRIIFITTTIFLSFIIFSSCKNWKEVEKKDCALEVMIQELPFEKEILILETTHRYLFERFEEDAIKNNGYKIQFGQKDYFVAQNDEHLFGYALEDDHLGFYLMVSMRKFILAHTENEVSVMVVKKMQDLND